MLYQISSQAYSIRAPFSELEFIQTHKHCSFVSLLSVRQAVATSVAFLCERSGVDPRGHRRAANKRLTIPDNTPRPRRSRSYRWRSFLLLGSLSAPGECGDTAAGEVFKPHVIICQESTCDGQ